MAEKDIIATLIKSGDDLNRQFVGNTKTINTRRVGVEKFGVIPRTQRVNCLTYDGLNFIIDDPIAGLLDSSTYGLDSGTLDSSIYCRVLNLNNNFQEQFLHSDFIDTSASSGTITTSTGSYFVDSSENLRSELIAKNEVAYTSATITAEGTDVSEAAIKISFDGGSTFTTTSLDTEITNSNTSVNGIIIDFNAAGLTFGSTGLAFPIDFSSTGTPFTLTKYNVQYN